MNKKPAFVTYIHSGEKPLLLSLSQNYIKLSKHNINYEKATLQRKKNIQSLITIQIEFFRMISFRLFDSLMQKSPKTIAEIANKNNVNNKMENKPIQIYHSITS